ncbi:hypothetical protein FE257_008756 [Aspergillus nanangensis]|uniref:Inner kinetochore subunit AME1 domain-containing protein n=1 Tax=Aspergillus nanangensis TaxID=2582783 RepID=A0AAD4CLA5_ASPNN|nr:hypothetical protein FE257_008756 [Aspergillus nanangensis]
MASNREERLQMRQRGAASRQIKQVDFGFSLGLGAEEPFLAALQGAPDVNIAAKPAAPPSQPAPSTLENTQPPTASPPRDVNSPKTRNSVQPPENARKEVLERPSPFDTSPNDAPDLERSSKRRRVELSEAGSKSRLVPDGSHKENQSSPIQNGTKPTTASKKLTDVKTKLDTGPSSASSIVLGDTVLSQPIAQVKPIEANTAKQQEVSNLNGPESQNDTKGTGGQRGTGADKSISPQSASTSKAAIVGTQRSPGEPQDTVETDAPGTTTANQTGGLLPTSMQLSPGITNLPEGSQEETRSNGPMSQRDERARSQTTAFSQIPHTGKDVEQTGNEKARKEHTERTSPKQRAAKNLRTKGNKNSSPKALVDNEKPSNEVEKPKQTPGEVGDEGGTTRQKRMDVSKVEKRAGKKASGPGKEVNEASRTTRSDKNRSEEQAKEQARETQPAEPAHKGKRKRTGPNLAQETEQQQDPGPQPTATGKRKPKGPAQSHGQEADPGPKPRPSSKGKRTRREENQSQEPEQESGAENRRPGKGKRTRREPEQVQEMESEQEPEPQPINKGKRKRKDADQAQKQTQELEPEPEQQDQPGPKRRSGQSLSKKDKQTQPEVSQPENGDEGSSQTTKKPRQPRGQTVPVTVHRLVNVGSLVGIPSPTDSSDEEESADELSSRQNTKPPSRGGVNAADVLGQICRETLEKTLTTLQNGIENEANATRRAEFTRKRKAVEAFGTELESRLFELSEMLDSNFVLGIQLKKAKKEMMDMRSRLYQIRKEREGVALQLDAVRRKHSEEEHGRMARTTINNSLHSLDLALERNQKRSTADADDGGSADPSPTAGLEFLLRSVAENVSSRASGAHGGLLSQIKSFNAQLEAAARALES